MRMRATSANAPTQARERTWRRSRAPRRTSAPDTWTIRHRRVPPLLSVARSELDRQPSRERPYPGPRYGTNWSRARSNRSPCRSTSAVVVSGHIRAMLWNGVISTPRLPMNRWRYSLSSGSSDRAD